MSARGKRYSNTEKAELVYEIMRQYATRTPVVKIAENLGLHHQTVYNWINQEYAAITAPISEQERKRDLDLIEQAIELCWKRIKMGNTTTTFTDLDRLLSRRAKMLGLDAPTEISAAVHHVDAKDIELLEIINEQSAKNAAVEQELRSLADGQIPPRQ